MTFSINNLKKNLLSKIAYIKNYFMARKQLVKAKKDFDKQVIAHEKILFTLALTEESENFIKAREALQHTDEWRANQDKIYAEIDESDQY